MTWGHVVVYPELHGRRVMLRPLVASDFDAWREVRTRSCDWLVKWEQRPIPGQPDPAVDKRAWVARCNARMRERELGTGYGFGIFVRGRFVGEINISSVQRGPFQTAYVGYWIDEAVAGNGYVPEAFVVVAKFAFEDPDAAPITGFDYPSQSSKQPGGRKTRLAQRGRSPALPRDKRCVGGPRPVRHNGGGLGGKAGAVPEGVGTAHLATAHLGTAHLGTAHLGTAHLGTAHLGTTWPFASLGFE